MPEPAREMIELHDSKLISINESEGSVCLQLKAYVHRLPEQPGGTGTGWVQDVEFRLAEAIVEAKFGELPWDIMDGAIHGTASYDNLLPLPCEIQGDIRFEISGFNDNCLRVRGAQLHIAPVGPARYVEETSADIYPTWLF